MGIALKSTVSPQLMRFIIAGACLLGLTIIWQTVQQKVHDLRFQAVYGEQSQAQALPIRADLYSLPIVMAKSDAPVEVGGIINDAEIEAAFREPKVEPVEEAEPPKVSLSQQLIFLYSPKVNGVSSNGAIVNGQFWAIGEPMVNMGIRDALGGLVTPRISSIGSGQVVLTLDDESLILPFDQK